MWWRHRVLCSPGHVTQFCIHIVVTSSVDVYRVVHCTGTINDHCDGYWPHWDGKGWWRHSLLWWRHRVLCSPGDVTQFCIHIVVTSAGAVWVLVTSLVVVSSVLYKRGDTRSRNVCKRHVRETCTEYNASFLSDERVSPLYVTSHEQNVDNCHHCGQRHWSRGSIAPRKKCRSESIF